jgi:predicted acetyltransferase
MNEFKLLIDTNIFIGLEDPKEVDPGLAELSRKCSEHRVRIFIHEAAVKDVARDKDATRREISLSKIRKFETLKETKLPKRDVLEEKFGRISRQNDEVDVTLLYALSNRAVDFLVTQDQGIHGRVKNLPLARQVLTIEDVLAWVSQTFEPATVSLPLVGERKAYEIELKDEIFDSLREGYPGFDEWWREKCVRDHRDCWTINIGGEIAGLVVRKDETHVEARTKFGGTKILKICTFKVKPKFWGEKFGELLLKQILWFAQRNAYDLAYLTTFPSQTFLIQVLEFYGFEQTLRRENGELFYEKPISRERLCVTGRDEIFELDRRNYPRFVCGPPSKAFCVPIQGKWHQRLFPELAKQTALPLFPDVSSFAMPSGQHRMPGNTIRKVYLCRAQTEALSPGDLLLFYQSSSPTFLYSQHLTSVGIVQSVSATDSLDQLVRLTAKRSVFSEAELREMIDESERPVKVIDFLLTGHLDPPIELQQLVKAGIFINHPPQSITILSPERLELVKSHMSFGFGV